MTKIYLFGVSSYIIIDYTDFIHFQWSIVYALVYYINTISQNHEDTLNCTDSLKNINLPMWNNIVPRCFRCTYKTGEIRYIQPKVKFEYMGQCLILCAYEAYDILVKLLNVLGTSEEFKIPSNPIRGEHLQGIYSLFERREIFDDEYEETGERQFEFNIREINEIVFAMRKMYSYIRIHQLYVRHPELDTFGTILKIFEENAKIKKPVYGVCRYS